MAPLVPRLLCVALFAAAGNAAGQSSKCKKRDMAGSLKDCTTIFLDFDKLSKPEVDKHGNTHHEIEFPDCTAKLISDTTTRIYNTITHLRSSQTSSS